MSDHPTAHFLPDDPLNQLDDVFRPIREEILQQAITEQELEPIIAQALAQLHDSTRGQRTTPPLPKLDQ